MHIQPKKIVVLGPESTGKSTLCENLAKHYGTFWVREYAREYLLAHGTNYSFGDLFTIAMGQLKLEDEGFQKAAAENKKLIVIDTDMYVMKVWGEFVFNKCDNRILNEIVKRRYDLYLLTDIDLPWTKDELREYPDLHTREKLFHHYKELLKAQNTPWAIVGGMGNARTRHAINAIESLGG